MAGSLPRLVPGLCPDPLQPHRNEAAMSRSTLARVGTSRHRTKDTTMAVDEAVLGEFIGKFVADLGATVAAGNVVVGHRLGLYAALAARPATGPELAERTDTAPRYVEEWLRGQAAGGYVQYDAERQTYSMSEEQAFVLANPDGVIYAPGAFVLALGALRAEDRITERFRTGAGLGWHEHDDDVFVGC